MNERRKNIEELLSCYIDGELGRREHTEVQRLVENSPELARELAAMRKQKLMLNSMPVSSAPLTIYDDVRAALERQSILDSHAHTASEKAGKRHLLLRRFATAAIVLIMLGSLMAIIAEIIIMPGSGSNGLIANNLESPARESLTPPLPQADVPAPVALRSMIIAPAVSPVQSFMARLDLHTSNPISMDNFVKKQVFNHDLLDYTMPTRSENQSAYKITAGLDQIQSFVADLGQAWPQTQSASLTISDPRYSESDIKMDIVSAEQVMQVFDQEEPAMRVEIARSFSGGADAGLLANQGSQSGSDMLPPDPGKPELATGERRQVASQANPGAEKVVLILTVYSE